MRIAADAIHRLRTWLLSCSTGTDAESIRSLAARPSWRTIWLGLMLKLLRLLQYIESKLACTCHTSSMSMSSRAARRDLKPHFLGIVVAIVGVLACAAPALLLIPGFGVLPVVAVWAWVYGYVGNASGRWPWWVMGQWLSLCAVFVVTLLILGLGLPTRHSTPRN